MTSILSDPSSDADASEPIDSALTATVSALDGVTDVYFPGAAIGQVTQLVGALVTGNAEQLNRVRVTARQDGTEIAARIGVDKAAHAPDVARSVADALLAAAPSEADTTVHVQVSRIA